MRVESGSLIVSSTLLIFRDLRNTVIVKELGPGKDGSRQRTTSQRNGGDKKATDPCWRAKACQYYQPESVYSDTEFSMLFLVVY
jgi:hypothetical protein